MQHNGQGDRYHDIEVWGWHIQPFRETFQKKHFGHYHMCMVIIGRLSYTVLAPQPQWSCSNAMDRSLYSIVYCTQSSRHLNSTIIAFAKGVGLA